MDKREFKNLTLSDLENIKKCESVIEYTFTDKNLLNAALTHKSYVNENSGEIDNERMEYLGDSVLQMIVTEYMYKKYPDFDEGTLSSCRASTVDTKSLLEIAVFLEAERFAKVSKGVKVKEKSGSIILANLVEALIGALFLDGGIDAAKKFIEKNFFGRVDKVLAENSWKDAKTTLQEMVQKSNGSVPVYEVIDVSGPEHERLFEVQVSIDGEIVSTGKGTSKHEAEFSAADAAIKKYT